MSLITVRSPTRKIVRGLIPVRSPARKFVRGPGAVNGLLQVRTAARAGSGAKLILPTVFNLVDSQNADTVNRIAVGSANAGPIDATRTGADVFEEIWAFVQVGNIPSDGCFAFFRLNPFTLAKDSAELQNNNFSLRADQVNAADWDPDTLTWNNKPAVANLGGDQRILGLFHETNRDSLDAGDTEAPTFPGTDEGWGIVELAGGSFGFALRWDEVGGKGYTVSSPGLVASSLAFYAKED